MSEYGASNLSNAQREYVGGAIELLEQREADILPRLEKTDPVQTNYRGRREPFESYGNASLGFANPAAGDLVTPGRPVLGHYLIPYVYMQVGLGLDYEALLNQAAGVVDQPLKQAIDSTAKRMVKWENIYLSNGDGTTKLAVASAAYDNTNATTRTQLTANGATDTIGATQVVPGQRGYIYDPTGTTQRVGTVGAGVLTISEVTPPTKTVITFTTNLPSDMISGDIFVPEGATPAAGFHGIPSLIANTGTIYGVSRTANPNTQSVIVTAGGGLSAALLYRTYLQIRQRTGKKQGGGMLELCFGITQQDAYYGLTTATAQLLFPHQRGERPNIDVGGADIDEFTWFGLKMNCFLDWLGTRIDYLNFAKLKVAKLKDGGEMLAPFDKPMPAISTTAGSYKMAQWQWWDVAREYFTPAAYCHGALVSLTNAGLAMQKS